MQALSAAIFSVQEAHVRAILNAYQTSVAQRSANDVSLCARKGRNAEVECELQSRKSNVSAAALESALAALMGILGREAFGGGS